jgi:hypothetical protein
MLCRRVLILSDGDMSFEGTRCSGEVPRNGEPTDMGDRRADPEEDDRNGEDPRNGERSRSCRACACAD